MRWNKLNIIPGDIVVLDKKYHNSSIVRVVSLTPNGLYSRVHSNKLTNPTDDDCWDVMTSRLSLKSDKPYTMKLSVDDIIKLIKVVTTVICLICILLFVLFVLL